MARTATEHIARLFAIATEIIEEAGAAAIEGQSQKRKRPEYLERAEIVEQAALKLEAIAVGIKRAVGDETA